VQSGEPLMTIPITEVNVLTESEKLYRLNERIEDWHASVECGYRFDLVLQDKWRLLVNQGGSL
jgi:hypothetical protein